VPPDRDQTRDERAETDLTARARSADDTTTSPKNAQTGAHAMSYCCHIIIATMSMDPICWRQSAVATCVFGGAWAAVRRGCRQSESLELSSGALAHATSVRGHPDCAHTGCTHRLQVVFLVIHQNGVQQLGVGSELGV
jgi:hypothetical protein